jgi:hypothetical protein
MWPIFHNLHVIHIKSYYKVNKNYKHEFYDILQGDQLLKKKPYVSWWIQISRYDANIAFKLHNLLK